MIAKLFLFVLSYFGAMASGAGVLVAAIFFGGFDIEVAIRDHPEEVKWAFTLYGALMAFMFFKLQDWIIVFRPKENVTPASKDELLARLDKAFSAPVDGKKLFDIAHKGDKVAITWSASIDYYQITSVGRVGKKRVVALKLCESAHTAFFIMKEKDWDWNISTNFARASLYYAVGIFAEFQMEIRPSLSVGSDGRIKADLKTLKYNSDELWMPIQECFLSSGWSLRGGMMPMLWQRIAFILPLAAIFYLMACFITWVGGQPKPAS